jgi:hypothetical protein
MRRGKGTLVQVPTSKNEAPQYPEYIAGYEHVRYTALVCYDVNSLDDQPLKIIGIAFRMSDADIRRN